MRVDARQWYIIVVTIGKIGWYRVQHQLSHLVVHEGNQVFYHCDKNCPMFKGVSVCSHVIVTSEVNGDLNSSVCQTCLPNLTAITNRGISSGPGWKVD